jgi:hypothetical protein
MSSPTPELQAEIYRVPVERLVEHGRSYGD